MGGLLRDAVEDRTSSQAARREEGGLAFAEAVAGPTSPIDFKDPRPRGCCGTAPSGGGWW